MASMQQFHQPYVLPSFRDAVPESWRSNNAPKPPASSLQTVVISSLSASQQASGHTDISVPLGPSAGIISQAYIRFTLDATTDADGRSVQFKGAQGTCLSLINRYTTSVNGIALDTISNFDKSAGLLLEHCTSSDYIKNDLAVLMGANVSFVAGTTPTGQTAYGASHVIETFCIPLFGFLAGTIPAYLMNGQLNIGIDFNSIARAFYMVAGSVSTYTISNVQLVYDRISPSQEFVDSVKMDLRNGNKFVIPYVNIQNVGLTSQTNANNLNIGVNYSSLRAVLLTQTSLTTDTDTTVEGLNASFDLTQFQVSCDGRLLSAVNYNSQTSPALCFLEAQKSCGRAWDSSISDPCAYLTAVNAASTVVARSYLTNNFFAGCSGIRCNEQLAFAGTPVSVLGINYTSTTNTSNITLLADFQALLDDQGNVVIYR